MILRNIQASGRHGPWHALTGTGRTVPPEPWVLYLIMKALALSRILLVAGLALLAACSTDPNQKKFGYLNDGNASFKAGKYQEAMIHYRNALRVDPRYAAAHAQLGSTYLALGNPDAAYKELNEAVILDSTNPEIKLQLAALLLGRRMLGEAKTLAESVLQTDSGNLRAHAVLGERYMLVGDLANAGTEFQKMIDLDPKGRKATICWGRCMQPGASQ